MVNNCCFDKEEIHPLCDSCLNVVSYLSWQMDKTPSRHEVKAYLLHLVNQPTPSLNILDHGDEE